MILPVIYCLTQMQEFPSFQLTWGSWTWVFALSTETESCSYCFSLESPAVSLAMAFLDVSTILYGVNYLHFLNRPHLYMCWKSSKSIAFYVYSAVLRPYSPDLPSVWCFCLGFFGFVFVFVFWGGGLVFYFQKMPGEFQLVHHSKKNQEYLNNFKDKVCHMEYSVM